MARTRKSTKQKTLFSWFHSKKNTDASSGLCAPLENKNVPKFLINLATAKEEIPNSCNSALNLKEKDEYIQEKVALISEKSCETFRSSRIQSRRLQSMVSSMDLALSCKDTEAFSEVHTNTVMKQNTTMNSISSTISRVKRKREKSSENQRSSNGYKRRKTSKSSNKIENNRSKIKSIWLYSNKTTLAWNHFLKAEKSDKNFRIPKTRKFQVFKDLDIFGDQLEMYSNEWLEIENDWDTDDEEINKSRKLMNKRLWQIKDKVSQNSKR